MSYVLLEICYKPWRAARMHAPKGDGLREALAADDGRLRVGGVEGVRSIEKKLKVFSIGDGDLRSPLAVAILFALGDVAHFFSLSS
jgi:hypothetical protein